jgi:hypothetical protein
MAPRKIRWIASICIQPEWAKLKETVKRQQKLAKKLAQQKSQQGKDGFR